MGNIAAAPVGIILSGQEFIMSPLRDKDVQEINNFIKQDILNTARTFCKTEPDDRIVQATMKAAMEQASKVDWLLNFDLLQTIERVAFLFWVCVKNSAPNPTRVDFTKIMIEDWEKNFDICMDALKLVNPTLMKQKKDQEDEEDNQENH